MPDAALTTDIIVGFPGETDDDFDATMRVVEQARFDQAYTFQYSPRPGTPAAEMRDVFVPPDVVAERYRRLETLTRDQSADTHRRLLGGHHELLVESPSRTDPSRLSGRTRGNHLVHFPAASATGFEYAPGDLVVVEVVEAATNYAVGSVPITVTRTAAGRATQAAVARGDGWTLEHVPGVTSGPRLPLVT
jgi:tRNA-2-methylthio-N6-dimethylallyladenosine synthase